MNHQKKLEKRLYLQSAALNAAANAILITDNSGIIEWVNPAFTEITGYPYDEIIGKHTRVLKSGVHENLFYESLWNTVLSGKVWHGELVNKRMDGTLYNEEQTITPVKDKNGEITHFIAIKQDITVKKNLEQQLIKSQRMESMGKLASGIAHDLNNILQPIMMSLSILKEQVDDEISNKWINILQDSANRGVSIVSQILSFGRGSERKYEHLGIKNLVNETKEILNATLPKSIEIKTDICEEPLGISGNLTQLHQVIMNMCVNALDAMPNGGVLTISVKNLNIDEDYAKTSVEAKPGPYVVIDISDTGEGIKSEFLENIFEPFFTTKEPGVGTGLGLSISYNIIKDHGGFINVYSELDKGTKFKIYIPAIIGNELIDEEKELTKDLQRGNGEFILVVDDETAIREITKIILEKNGYNVLTAKDGAEAISKYNDNKDEIELVIMDNMMPVMSGPASIKVLRKINSELKVISSSGLKNDIKEEYADEANAELSKPYTTEQLLTTVNKTIK